ncbi:MAG: hypothetical protein HY366_01145 [Candidatus Aenigmarchaeota archaeon]|nr:hypothetical protein [Candidatus Aenigmarchaeota archaeon]
MAALKDHGRKKRFVSRAKLTSAPLWASLKKFGLKRARSRRIRVLGEKHWRRDSKLKV